MAFASQRAPQGERLSLGRRLPLWVFRAAALLAGIAMFFPPANPGRISEKINASASLFTNGVSYGTITNSMGRILRSQWIQDADITLLMVACIVVMLGVILCGVGGCMSLGNRKMRRRGFLFPLVGAPVMAVGLALIRLSYSKMLAHGEEVGKLDKIGDDPRRVLDVLRLRGAAVPDGADRLPDYGKGNRPCRENGNGRKIPAVPDDAAGNRADLHFRLPAHLGLALRVL